MKSRRWCQKLASSLVYLWIVKYWNSHGTIYICISKPISPLVLRNSTEDTVAEECKIKFIDKEIFQIEGPPGTVKSLEYVLNCFINFVLKQAPCLKQIVAKVLILYSLTFLFIIYIYSGYRHWNWVLKRFYHSILCGNCAVSKFILVP